MCLCYLRLLKKQLDTDSKTKLNGKKLIQLSIWKFKLEGIGKIKIITWLLQKKKKKKTIQRYAISISMYFRQQTLTSTYNATFEFHCYYTY